MKCTSSRFRFEGDGGKILIVSFFHESLLVVVHDLYCNSLLEIDNGKRQYKPCVTHATEILKLALSKPNASNFAKRRTKKMKPKLKVMP